LLQGKDSAIIAMGRFIIETVILAILQEHFLMSKQAIPVEEVPPIDKNQLI
jgi:hypothetical protein